MATKKTVATQSSKPVSQAATKVVTPSSKVTTPVETPVKKIVVAGPVEKKAKQKVKVVRDSFTMPQAEYQQIAAIKLACSEAGLLVKKSEVLRAGLKLLSGLTPLQLKRAMGGLEKIQTGRPKKH